jgi:hypothetical protein
VKDETAPAITLRPLPAFALEVGLGLTSSIWGREWLIALVTLRDRPPSRRYLRAHHLLSDEAPCDEHLSSAPGLTYPPTPAHEHDDDWVIVEPKQSRQGRVSTIGHQHWRAPYPPEAAKAR